MQANKRTKHIIAVAIGCAAALYSCESTESKPFEMPVSAPFKETVPFATTKVSADSGGVLTLESGSRITLPANALVDKNGNPVTGEVDLKFREFHSADDILLSGIPMQLDENGYEYMSSGGMMEIRASQNGEELELAQGKSASIELISEVDIQEGYQLFYLNDDKTWSKGESFKCIPNTRKDSTLTALDKADSTLNNTFKIQADFQYRPYIKMWENVDWKKVKCKSDLPWDDVKDVIWESISVRPTRSTNGVYVIDIISTMHEYNGKFKQWPAKIYAKPQLSEKELAALKEKQEADNEAYEKRIAKMYDEHREALQNEKKWEAEMLQEAQERFAEVRAELARRRDQLQRQAPVMSQFPVRRMGVHNIDRMFNAPPLASYVADFDVKNEKIDRVCLIHYDERTVRTFKPGNAIPFEEKPNTCLVIVLQDGSGRKVSKEKYESLINKDTVKEQRTKLKLTTDHMDIHAFTRENARRNSIPKFV